MGRIRKKISLVKRGRGKVYPFPFMTTEGDRVEEKGVFSFRRRSKRKKRNNQIRTYICKERKR